MNNIITVFSKKGLVVFYLIRPLFNSRFLLREELFLGTMDSGRCVWGI